ncbi:MAG: selenocysteine-specific translation elongation factor [Siculibacillus sp.]|nr:selenocysteine-specific translation elongation factor [Siculibacillus sp.]
MIVGTAGHIDHGKTTLVGALTGVDTDRLAEEKARGITIDLGFAYLPAPGGRVVGFVDVPGHEKFVHNMLAGATGIDFVLLVVDAAEGVKPQTREHLAIVDLLGLTRGLVVLTKVDLADAERRAATRAEVEAMLAGTGLEGASILAVSAVSGEGIEALRDRLFAEAAALGARRDGGRFRLAVDRCFTLTGAGTVVTGTVSSGAVAVGDRIIVSPSGPSARVRGIHAQNRRAEIGRAGDRCALNLSGDGVTKEAIRRGDVVGDPALHAPTARIDAELRVLPVEVRPIGQWMPVRLHVGAAEVGARVVVLADEPIAPGERGLVQLVLDRPIAAAWGDRFVLRDTSAQRTLGGGRFLDLRPPARKRRTAERRAELAARAIDDPAAALAALLAAARSTIDLDAFARDRALGAEEGAAIVDRVGVVRLAVRGVEHGLAATAWEHLRRTVAARLRLHHDQNPDLPGQGLERLRLDVAPAFAAPAFRALLQGLARRREVVVEGAWVRLPDHTVRLGDRDEATWGEIRDLLGGSERFRPPRVRDLAATLDEPEEEVRRLMKLLARLGRVDEVAHDHFFLRETVAEMVEIVVDLGARAAGGEFTAADFRDRVDNGRKVAIQILEFFDRHGITLRRGDPRRVNRHRLDLFRSVREGDKDDGGEGAEVTKRPGETGPS